MAIKGQLCFLFTTLLLVQCQGKHVNKDQGIKTIEAQKAVQTSGAESTGAIAGELSEISEEKREASPQKLGLWGRSAEPPQFGLWGKRQSGVGLWGKRQVEEPQLVDKKGNSLGLWGKRGNGLGLWGRSPDQQKRQSPVGLLGRSADPGNGFGLWGKRQKGLGLWGRSAEAGNGFGLWGREAEPSMEKRQKVGLWGRSAEPQNGKGQRIGLWGRSAEPQNGIGLWGRSSDSQERK